MVFKFRMLSDENDHFVRDYEVPYDMTLLGFHEFITRSLGYEEGMSVSYTHLDVYKRQTFSIGPSPFNSQSLFNSG